LGHLLVDRAENRIRIERELAQTVSEFESLREKLGRSLAEVAAHE
jgi:hypothetical protein